MLRLEGIIALRMGSNPRFERSELVLGHRLERIANGEVLAHLSAAGATDDDRVGMARRIVDEFLWRGHAVADESPCSHDFHADDPNVALACLRNHAGEKGG